MKKGLKSLLPVLLALPLLVACGDDDPRPVEEIVADNALTALGQVNIVCNTWSQSAGLSRDAELLKSVTVEGYMYSVDYTLSSSYTYSKAFAKIDGDTLKITVPENTELPEEQNQYASYSIAGSVKFAGMEEGKKGKKGYEALVGQEFASNSWRIRINATNTLELSAAELYTNTTLKSGKTRVVTYGIFAGSETDPGTGFTGAASNKYSLYFDDGEHSFVAYDQTWKAYPTDLVVGNVYKVVGIYSNYYDTIEITAPVITAAPEHVCAPAVVKTFNDATANFSDKSNASRKVSVTGVITKITAGYEWGWLWSGDNLDSDGKSKGGNKFSIYVNVTGTKKDDKLVDECYAYVHQFDLETTYKSWSSVDVSSQDAANLMVGATITFTGRLYWYSGAAAVYASSLTSFIPAE